MKLNIIIPNYNGRRFLSACLHSLTKQTFTDFDVIIVDNASSDDSIRWLSDNYPDVHIIALSENTGFAAAVNVGICHSKSPYIMVLNNDTILAPDCIANLICTMEKSAKIFSAGANVLTLKSPHLTDTNGDFIFSKTDFPFMEYRLIIEDIDWDKNKAIYASDTITVTFDSNDFSGGEGWSLGSASKEIQIQLKEYIDTHTEPYTLYTFYGRVTDQDGWPVPGVTIYTSPAYTPNIDEDITSFPAVTDETGRYQFTYDQAPATEHTLYARLSPSFSDPQYPWKTDSIVVNFGEIELIDGEGMLIGRGSKEVNFQLVHSSPQK